MMSGTRCLISGWVSGSTPGRSKRPGLGGLVHLGVSVALSARRSLDHYRCSRLCPGVGAGCACWPNPCFSSADHLTSP